LANNFDSGAQIVFRSFLAPTFGRYFAGSGSTASNLRSKAEGFNKAE
jgi:receptor expression-enhancing protein 5/6